MGRAHGSDVRPSALRSLNARYWNRRDVGPPGSPNSAWATRWSNYRRPTLGTGPNQTSLRTRLEDSELAFFSVVASFGTPIDITVAELAIESFFPANTETADFLRLRLPQRADGELELRRRWYLRQRHNASLHHRRDRGVGRQVIQQ